MKRILMVLAATVICGACLFTSCKKDEEKPDNPATGEDETHTIGYDNYPNIMTGMPLADAIFFPETIASKASVHNRYFNNQEYTYGNGRLIRSTVFTDDVNSVTYYTYSDGTTGRE